MDAPARQPVSQFAPRMRVSDGEGRSHIEIRPPFGLLLRITASGDRASQPAAEVLRTVASQTQADAMPGIGWGKHHGPTPVPLGTTNADASSEASASFHAAPGSPAPSLSGKGPDARGRPGQPLGGCGLGLRHLLDRNVVRAVELREQQRHGAQDAGSADGDGAGMPAGGLHHGADDRRP